MDESKMDMDQVRLSLRRLSWLTGRMREDNS